VVTIPAAPASDDSLQLSVSLSPPLHTTTTSTTTTTITKNTTNFKLLFSNCLSLSARTCPSPTLVRTLQRFPSFPRAGLLSGTRSKYYFFPLPASCSVADPWTPAPLQLAQILLRPNIYRQVHLGNSHDCCSRRCHWKQLEYASSRYPVHTAASWRHDEHRAWKRGPGN
jgi:hypothetical protein